MPVIIDSLIYKTKRSNLILKQREIMKTFSTELLNGHISAASHWHALEGTRSQVAKQILVVPNQHLFLPPSY